LICGHRLSSLELPKLSLLLMLVADFVSSTPGST
jgi:hypothetical protein